MQTENQNINSFIRKVLTIGLFLFLIVVFKNNYCHGLNNAHKSPVAITVLDIKTSDILVETVDFHFYNNILVTSDLPDSYEYKSSVRINQTNSLADQILHLCNENFIKIKPLILRSNHHYIRTSLNRGETLLIS